MLNSKIAKSIEGIVCTFYVVSIFNIYKVFGSFSFLTKTLQPGALPDMVVETGDSGETMYTRNFCNPCSSDDVFNETVSHS